MVEHRVHGAVCHALTAGEYWIALSDALVADTLYRRCPMTARQAVQSFGNAVSDQVRAMYARSEYEQIDRKRVVEGKGGAGRVDPGGRSIIKKNKQIN